MVLWYTIYTESGQITKEAPENTVLISAPSFNVQAVLHEDGTLEGTGGCASGEFPTTTSIAYTWNDHSPAGGTTFNITGTKH